jgi:G:T/U-mismatch repair DNA glycosylase
MSRVEGFPPIASERSKVLILGTMPEHLLAHHGGAIRSGAGAALRKEGGDTSVRRCFCMGRASVLREDWQSYTSIRAAVTNDFLAFFAQHPSITHVFFNGDRPERVFRRRVFPALTENRYILKRLPSTSSAHTAMRREAKMQAWSVIKTVL